ncbi:hypothetical protein HYC85_020222 [Camellia sinensis]|uniref:Uncharacterized protein n=1 Tax=Camellia sinensis TaxID=4442 RepID=A0A7J7GPE7_CAMSI|nr:hypothetical protein HYC85_020222 [Camellia sinensis]
MDRAYSMGAAGTIHRTSSRSPWSALGRTDFWNSLGGVTNDCRRNGKMVR